MTTARSKIVDVDVTRFYHCLSRCVRGAFLCGDGFEHRKQWIEERLEKLVSSFAVSIAGFAVMDNHLHVLTRLDPDEAESWSDQEVVKRWLSVYTPRGLDWSDPSSVQHWVDQYSQNPEQIAEYRDRLSNLGWFMKALKEPLARIANKEEDNKGAFWDGRYKSIAVLDDEALLATCTYIDLNPVAAGVSSTPESSRHTSIRQRVEHFRRTGKLDTLATAKQGSVAASHQIGNAEQDHWLIPFEDRRPHTNCKPSSDREGLLEKFTLGNYLLLVDYVGRMFRQGKARISDEVREIFERLDTSIEVWSVRMSEMLCSRELRGRCFAGSAAGIAPATSNRLAQKANGSRVNNLSPQPTR